MWNEEDWFDARPPMISKDGFIDREPPILGEMTGP